MVTALMEFLMAILQLKSFSLPYKQKYLLAKKFHFFMISRFMAYVVFILRVTPYFSQYYIHANILRFHVSWHILSSFYVSRHIFRNIIFTLLFHVFTFHGTIYPHFRFHSLFFTILYSL